MKNKKELDRITKLVLKLHDSFQGRICNEFSWTKHQYKKKKKKEKNFSENEIVKMRAIGWELANDLRRKIAK